MNVNQLNGLSTIHENSTCGQCKTQTAHCRLQTADCGPGVKCRLSVKCRLQTKSKTQTGVKCRIKTVDFFKHLCSFFFKSVK